MFHKAPEATPQVPEVSNPSTLKNRILATYKATVSETTDRIEAAEVAEADLRRQFWEQLICTLIHSQDVMIPARRVYAAIASLTQTCRVSPTRWNPPSKTGTRDPGTFTNRFSDSKKLAAT